MRFSVVIPAHNGARFIGETLESVLGQKRPADEVLVVDDCSTDETAAICKGSFLGERVTYRFNAVSTGFVDAWNRCIQYSTGDFVTILHQDDLLAPDYLGEVEMALQCFPGVLHLYAGCHYIDGQGRPMKTSAVLGGDRPFLFSGKEYACRYAQGVFSGNHIHRCPGVTTSRELLLNICTYRKEAGHIADDDFFLRVGAYTNVVEIPRPLASYRIHGGSETSKLDLLPLTLAKDYLFQVRQHLQGSTLLGAEEIGGQRRLAVRFLTLLLFQAVLHRNETWLTAAFNLRNEMEGMLPGYLEQTLPSWGRSLWKLAFLRGGKLLVWPVVQGMHGTIKLRDWLKGGFGGAG